MYICMYVSVWTQKAIIKSVGQFCKNFHKTCTSDQNGCTKSCFDKFQNQPVYAKNNNIFKCCTVYFWKKRTGCGPHLNAYHLKLSDVQTTILKQAFWHHGNRFRGWGWQLMKVRGFSQPHFILPLPSLDRLTNLNKLCTKNCRLTYCCEPWSLNLKMSPQGCLEFK